MEVHGSVQVQLESGVSRVSDLVLPEGAPQVLAFELKTQVSETGFFFQFSKYLNS